MSEELERERLNLEREIEREKINLEREKINKQSISQRTATIISLVSVAFGAVAGGTIEGIMNIKLEEEKRESQLVIRAMETADPSKSFTNLCALWSLGFIEVPKEQEFKGTCKTIPENPPSLPARSASNLVDLVAEFEGKRLTVDKDPLTGIQIIGYSHVLTSEEIKSGEIVIEGNPVNFKNGITEEQAKKLLDQDLKPIRLAVDNLVKVPLNENQLKALISFAFHQGLTRLENSTLLEVLNEGKYEQVPDELKKFTKVGGRSIPGWVERRKAEIALWNEAPSSKP